MPMGVTVYYAEISASKEMKKRQQRVMMILDSKVIPYEAIDITEPGKESDKDFMLNNAKARGDSKKIFSPQIFNGEVYCGDYEDFDLANENDVLEEFLNVPKVERKFSLIQNNGNVANGASRESSAEAENKQPKSEPEPEVKQEISTPAPSVTTEESTPAPVVPEPAPAATTAANENEDDDGFNEKNITDQAEGVKSSEGGEAEVSSTTVQQQQEPNVIPAAGDDDVDDGIEDLSQED